MKSLSMPLARRYQIGWQAIIFGFLFYVLIELWWDAVAWLDALFPEKPFFVWIAMALFLVVGPPIASLVVSVCIPSASFGAKRE